MSSALPEAPDPRGGGAICEFGRKIHPFQHIGMCDPRVSLELQTTAEDFISDTVTEGKCQSEVSVDLPGTELNLAGLQLSATWTRLFFCEI